MGKLRGKTGSLGERLNEEAIYSKMYSPKSRKNTWNAWIK